MISFSDERWIRMNKTIINNKFKSINSNFIENTLDSGEEAEEGNCFLKGGTITALWNTIVSHVDK